MKIIVCVKQVPDTTEVKINKETGTLIRDGVPSILNPDDANALEEALRMKDADSNVHVTVVSMGPPQAEEMLRECLAMGADEAVLLSDRAFGGSDTWSTSNAIASGIKTLGEFDIIFAGRQAIDGDTAQVGPQIAEHLNLPSVTYVEEIEAYDKSIVVKRAFEDGYQMIKVQTPCLITALKELNDSGYMNVQGIFEAFEGDKVEIWSVNDIEVDPDNLGLKGSPTKVKKSFTKGAKTAGKVFDVTPQEAAQIIVDKLQEKYLI